MNQSNYEKAFTAALLDPKTVDLLAKTTAKKLLEFKSTPANLEETLVKNHVIFAEAASLTGKWMVAKEVNETIIHFNTELDIRPRVLGKALLGDCIANKNTRNGKAYFIEAIVEEINAEALEEIANNTKEAEENATKEPAPKKEEKKEELLDVDFEEVKHLIDEDMLDFLLTQYETPEDYMTFLESLSRKKLIKHINKYKMPISVEDKSIDAVVVSVVKFMDNYSHLPETKEEEEDAPEPLCSLSDFMESIKDLGKKKHKKAMKQRLKDEEEATANSVEILASADSEPSKKEKKKNKKKDKKDK